MQSKPEYRHLKVFGCLAVASNPSRVADKFDSRGVPCVFLGYPQHQKGYKLLNLLNHTRFVSRDVVFYEHIFPYSKSSMTQVLQPIPAPLSSPVLYEDFVSTTQPVNSNPETHSSSEPEQPTNNNDEQPEEEDPVAQSVP